jgi:DNA mismatch repair protein MutS
MMKQYHDAKEQNPDALLLFRMGDFYELFFQDAEVIARELQLTLTTRDGLVPMAGFPHHQFEPYLRRLIQAGHRVAVCEQVEDPQLAKGLVKREVVRVVTPGTLIEDSLLDPRQSNHLAALCVEGDRAGLAWADPSTGLFQAADIPIQRLSDELSRLEVAECLWPEGVPYPDRLTDTLAQLSVTFRQPWTFETRAAHEALLKHFGVQTMQGFGFEDEAPCLRAAGALLLYLHET